AGMNGAASSTPVASPAPSAPAQPSPSKGEGKGGGAMPTSASSPSVGGIVEVKVPDIGDFKDVPVIEVMVKAGDTIKAEDSLVTLESEKATIDVPAPVAGTVKEVKLKTGDKVSEGSLVLLLQVSGAAAAKSAPVSAPVSATPAPAAAVTTPT